MTNVIVNAIDVLGQEIDEGVVRISAADAQYNGGLLMLPEYHEQELVAGSTTITGVTSGKVVVTLHWDINRTATFRVFVPDTTEITLAELALQKYDSDPAVVSKVADAALRAEDAADRAGEIADDFGPLEAVTGLVQSATDAASSASGSASAASSSASAAATSESNAAGSASSAAGSASSAASSASAAAGSASAAAGSADAAAGSESQAASSATAAASAASVAESSASTAEDAAERAEAGASTVGDAQAILAARDQAVTAKDGAVTAQTAAEAAADTAASAAATEVNKLKAGAPAAFDTLLEIANELGENETERAALANSIATKAEKAYVDSKLASLPPGGRNLFPDPSFEDGTDHTAVAVPDALSGQHVARLDAGKWTAGGTRGLFFTGGETRTYEVTYQARAVNFPAGYEGTETVGLRFKRFDGDREYIGEYYPPQPAMLSLRDLPSEWVQYHAVFEVNSDHKYLSPYFVVSGGSALAGAFVDIDEVFLADVTEREELRTHTHTSEHISDATHLGGEGSAGKVVKWHSNGEILRPGGDTPGHWESLVNRRYVDQEVAKKANASHTHTSANITDARTWTGRSTDSNAVVMTDAGGWFYVGNSPTHGNHPTNKAYVDGRTPDVRVVSVLPASPTAGVVYLVTG